jgi:hypothetical protein
MLQIKTSTRKRVLLNRSSTTTERACNEGTLAIITRFPGSRSASVRVRRERLALHTRQDSISGLGLARLQSDRGTGWHESLCRVEYLVPRVSKGQRHTNEHLEFSVNILSFLSSIWAIDYTHIVLHCNIENAQVSEWWPMSQAMVDENFAFYFHPSVVHT